MSGVSMVNGHIDEMKKEYIERGALLTDINETVVFTVRKGTPLPTTEMRGANKVIDQIKSAPTADVVEVVRCENCIHWGGTTFGFICRKFSGIETKICMGADQYCSYGERKESGVTENA